MEGIAEPNSGRRLGLRREEPMLASRTNPYRLHMSLRCPRKDYQRDKNDELPVRSGSGTPSTAQGCQCCASSGVSSGESVQIQWSNLDDRRQQHRLLGGLRVGLHTAPEERRGTQELKI